jgi:hypothetical protein
MLTDSSKQVTAEKRLQLTTYSQALRKYFEGVIAAEVRPDDKFLVRLRAEYAVTKAEHAAVLDELLRPAGNLAPLLAEELRTIERSAQTVRVLELSPSPTHDFLADLLRRGRAQAVEGLMRGLSFTLTAEKPTSLRVALYGADEALRESVVEQLRDSLPPAIAEMLISAFRETRLAEASMSTLTDMLHARLQSVDPYVRAVSLFALGERGAVTDQILETTSKDEHEIIRETALHLRDLKGKEPNLPGAHAGLITIEKMMALRAAPIFSRLSPEGLAELARESVEDDFSPGEDLCLEGESGKEVFILLSGEVEVIATDDKGEEVLSTERTGGFIGELAVLDPAPRSARLRSGQSGARVLRLDGDAFSYALNAESSIASHVIRTLAQRVRREAKK